MPHDFPKLKPTGLTAESGVNAVSTSVNDDLRWLFRRNHNETDFGIDGHIDVVLADGSVTGQTFAMQIKSGVSYFKRENLSTFRYDGDLKHFNYYSNHPSPVLLVIYDPRSRLCYWVHFRAGQAVVGPTGWSYEVPRDNVLNAAAGSKLLEIVRSPRDYLAEARESSVIEESLQPFEFLHYAIDRHDVERLDPTNLKQFFERISSSERLCRKFQGRVEISVAGFENDARELWEIEEVRRYFLLADPEVLHWFFFLDPDDERFGLKVYFLCMTAAKRAKLKNLPPGRVKAKIDMERLVHVFNTNWPRLNEMTDRLHMSIEENKRISFAVGKVAGFNPVDA
jgi:hypothetical protein